ncbi:MAG: ABC transporter permease subunit [Blastocatellia bacterium]|nr:ABC transporter permease subunit [Blastocatellia bacterium]
MDLIDFFIRNREEVFTLTLQHMFLVAVAIGAAVAVGVPVGVLLTRWPSLSKSALAAANILQTIPSLALFGFLIPLLGAYGIGRVPAIIALFLYSLLPIIRNTFTGISGVDPAVREAARGMGMTDWQMLTQVELPLSLGVIVAGVRVATVISVGTATIAAAIGAGGLGMYIFRGLRMYDNTLILAGAVPAALMSLGADFLLGLIEKALAPSRARGRDKYLKWATAACLVAAVVGAFLLLGSGADDESLRRAEVGDTPLEGARRVVVGSKDFTEQVILGEMMAQALESAGFAVERRFELGGDLTHRAMLEGTIDAYVEYTGTAFTAVLKHAPISDNKAVYDQVQREYAERFNLVWLAPLGFNNTFAILVRGEVARGLNLKTISDAARHARGWRAGFGQDFMSRQDGYPGFAKTYGLTFAERPLEMDLALTYRALADGRVDLIAGNSTDGLINKLDLFQLEDDRRYFPPYEAAPVVRKEILERYPQIRDAMERLAGRLTDAEMRRLNYAVDGEHRDVKEVVREFLSRKRL